MRKSRAKLRARDKKQAEENEKNLEEPFSKAEGVGNCVADRPQEDNASEELRGQAGEAPGEKGDPGNRATQNGPAGRSGPEPGEETLESGQEDAAVQPLPEDDK